MLVKVRKDSGKYLAYFLDSRRLVEINEIGAIIVDLLFNHKLGIDEIVSKISVQYDVPISRVESDAIEFLTQLKDEVQPDGFNLVDQRMLEVPLGIELEITTSCNLRCLHCYQDDHAAFHMSFDRAKEIIDILAKNQIYEISLIGGEPFMHPSIMGIIRYCDAKEMAITIVTNGTLLDKEKAAALSNIRRLVVIVSIDGTPEIHEQIRGKGKFAKADAAIDLLKSCGISTEVNFTLNALNLPKHREVVEYCKEKHIPCNFNLFKPFRQEHECLTLDPEKYFTAFLDLLRLRQEGDGYQIGLSNAAVVAEMLELPPRNECRATMSGMVIDVNGKMITCPSLVSAGYYADGDLPDFDEGFVEKWQTHQAFKDFRENGLCECQARAMIFSNSVKGYDPYGIVAFKQFLKS